MSISFYIYICVTYIYVYLHIQTCLSPHSQSLNAPVRGGYFPSAAVGSLKWDFPRQHSGSTNLPVAQSGSDCARKGMSISSAFSKILRN